MNASKTERMASKTVWFGNYSAWMTADVLRALMPDLNDGPNGEDFLELRIVHGTGGKLLSYCFLEFPTVEAAQAALERYNGVIVELTVPGIPDEFVGKRIRLKLNYASAPPSQRPMTQHRRTPPAAPSTHSVAPASAPVPAPAPTAEVPIFDDATIAFPPPAQFQPPDLTSFTTASPPLGAPWTMWPDCGLAPLSTDLNVWSVPAHGRSRSDVTI